ncbi:22178_t:CDS:10, partial [Gigaspora margarita]
MAKIDKFTLDIKFCHPYSGISQFFAKTWLFKWNSIDLFTRFIYELHPIMTPQQVFDIYYQNLSDIIAIKHIGNNVIQYVRDIIDKRIQKECCLKVIGDTLLHIRSLRARKQKKTQINFQIAEQNDQINKRFDVYAIIDSDEEAGSSKRKYYNNESDSNIAEPAPNNINQLTIDTENRVNDVLLPHKDLGNLGIAIKPVIFVLNDRAIESKLVDLTNWSSVEWSQILKTEDKAKLFRSCEYIKFGNESTKVDVAVELHNYVETGNSDLKLREDHTALKIELKDMLDNFRNELHFKKKDIAKIFVMGIQITGLKWVIYCLLYNYDADFYFLSEVATLVIPRSLSAMEQLLGPFIKNLLGFR